MSSVVFVFGVNQNTAIDHGKKWQHACSFVLGITKMYYDMFELAHMHAIKLIISTYLSGLPALLNCCLVCVVNVCCCKGVTILCLEFVLLILKAGCARRNTIRIRL